jgi:xanthine dehydrogenase YagS FAD-binding subunit
MRNFSYQRPESIHAAVRAREGRSTMFLAGGTTLLDLMKLDVMRPEQLIDVNRLPLDKVKKTADGRLEIGALVSNTALAQHPEVKTHYPVLSQALLSGASTSLRNKATTGGNVMQRVRCHYFRDGVSPCNKREPGSGCSAINGMNRSVHAVLGTSDQCIAAHPSDMCVAMAAIGATVLVNGPSGSREIDFLDFHQLPGETPYNEHALRPGELITHVVLDAPVDGARSTYLKLRDRASYQFALASSGVIVAVQDNRIQHARIAMGGVGTKPWRAANAEQSLLGQPPGREVFSRAADIAFENARPYAHNAFKIPLGKQAVIRSLITATS